MRLVTATTFLLAFFTASTLPCWAGNTYKISWESLKKRAEDYYRIPPLPDMNKAEFLSLNRARIQKLGGRLLNFDKMVNQVDSRLSMEDLLLSTSMNGLPSFGNPNTTINQDVIGMMFYLLEKLDKNQNLTQSDRLFKRLVSGFEHCQQVQYRTITEIFQELMDQSSLKIRVAVLLDDIKRKWLRQALYHIEQMTTYDINPHVENSYIKAIGEQFGLPGYVQAQMDQFATNSINRAKAQQVFRSFVNVNEIISTILENFVNADEPREKAEIFRWVSEGGYPLDQFYDEKGEINRTGVEAILSDLMGVLVPADYQKGSDIVKRQELLFESLFPTSGYLSWEEFEQTFQSTESFSGVRKAFDQNQVELTVMAPSNKRTAILNQGLLNQFQTGSGGGHFGFPGRFGSERSQLNMTEEEYEQVPLEIRPKYGAILSREALSESVPRSTRYGDDVFLLNLERLQNRVTWVPGSSSFYRYFEKANRVKISSRNGDGFEPSQWDDLYLPWSKIQLLIPFLNGEKFFSSFDYLPKSSFIKPDPAINKIGTILGCHPDYHFAEFQVWGEVTPADIKTFIFTQSRPDPSQLKVLSRYRIQTFDGTVGSPIPYRVSFYESEESGRCQKLQFDLDHLSVLEEDANPRNCRSLVGTMDALSKNSKIGPSLYERGDWIFNPDTGLLGQIDLLFDDGFARIRYPNQNGTDEICYHNLKAVHKRLLIDRLQEKGVTFKVREKVIYPSSGEKGSILEFYDNKMARVEFIDQEGRSKSRFIRLKNLSKSKPKGWSRVKKAFSCFRAP